MAFARAVLVLSVLAWAGFGTMLLVWPERLGGVGLEVVSPLARIEVRGFYGGLELGLAAFFAWCLAATDRFGPGLMLGALALGGTAAGRLMGIALEGGTTTGQMWGFVAVEAAGASLCVAALVRLPRAQEGTAG
jgi:hypothetical protein